MKFKGLLVGALALGLGAAACGSDDADTSEFGLVEAGTLTVCTDIPFPPMEFEDPDAPTGYSGFDIELMEAISADLGLETKIDVPGWEAITSGLAMEAGNCDISASSITITEEREENVDFSESYFTADQSLLVNEGGPASIDAVTALAVQTGTTGEIWATENAGDGVEIVSFEAAGDLYLALDAGEVDGVITDLVGNQGYVDENPGVASVVQTFTTDEQYGLAVQEEGSEALLEAVNTSLQKLRDDGTYDTIFDKYFSG
jgi:polar amino acid transport system substrate-binding protein